MLTELLLSLKTSLEALPSNSLASPWQDFPNGMEVIVGVVPTFTKESVTLQPKVVLVPDIQAESIRFEDDGQDRCGGEKTYGVLFGILAKLQVVDPLSLESGAFEEVKGLIDLSEGIAGLFAAGEIEPDGLVLAESPKLVFLAESDRLQQRIFASWWRLSYG